MFNLIKKDLKMHISPMNLLAYAFMVVVGFCMFSGEEAAMRNLLIVGYVSLAVALGLFPYDEKYNFYMILNSLPIKKSNVVIARYLSSIIIMLILIFTAAIATGVSNFGTRNMLAGFNMNYIFRILAPYFLFIAIAYPLHYKLDYKKARIANALCYILYFSVVIGLFGAGTKFNIEGMSNVIARYGTPIAFLLWLLSMKLSTGIYLRKNT